MNVSSLWSGSALGSTVLFAFFAGCGGLDDGAITIRDEKSSGGSGGSSVNQGGDGNGTGSGGDGGGDGGEPPVVISDDPPVVVSVTPEADASDAEPDAAIEIEFSETLDESTVNADTVVIHDGDRVVEGELEFSGVTATFTPSRRLDLLATLSVTVTTGVTDLAGIELEEEFTSSFQVRDGVWGHKVTLSNALGGLPEQKVPPPVVDASGNGLAVWVQYTSEDMNAVEVVWGRHFTPGEGWGESFPVSGTAATCRQPVVAMNEDGQAIVAWYQQEGNFGRVYARRYVDGVWEEEPHRIESGDYAIDYQARMAAAVSPGGDMHVVWNYHSTYWYLGTNQSRGFDTWDTGDTYLSGSWDYVSAPVLAFAPDDTGFLGWVHTSGSTNNVRFLRYIPGVGWQSGTTGEGTVGAPSGWSSHHANAAADAEGGAMVVWNTDAEAVATSRFTKAGGWGDPVPANPDPGYLSTWSAKLAFAGEEVVAVWGENVDGVNNVYANRYTGNEWGAEPTLLSDGDTSVHEMSDAGFGLDRHGNGIVTWTQNNTVRFARLIGSSGAWLTSDLLDAPEMLQNSILESSADVAPNGVAVTLYQESYPYASPNRIFAAAFD
jgi:hypothetical protein